ncbi:serine/threonine protein kinase [Nitrosomonas oligotropha]|uniref:Protein kinase domain-containing protein n=1 Tax=Nitrosomonas oligotropha TaxID=42354 RepID=A0A1H8N7F0_9PROT|nr:protein kinase [Nitrosomonas oligotropha]SDX06506.1 Protein kinase domain-containing protein [Nitrosomonas oligotropha]SEO25418.1 Protein kinase domain-containing protein [Nitrosomonas oligotropha]
MSLSQNSQLLVSALEAIPLLNGRFEKIKLINVNSFNNEKRGCFSLVFSAHDIIEDAPVALKFYDIHPDLMNDDYRRACFRREHDILQILINKSRCLQLVSALSTFNLIIPFENGSEVTLPCEYFAVEWINNDIDDYFYRQENFDPLDKLQLFNELTLAIEALHRHEVFHRDLKPDNLRQYQDALKRIVVAIDLGTAARFSSGAIQQRYQHNVGAPAYAAPEAIIGLAGHRKLAPYTDCYALGCMLYELFNRDIFYRALLARNPRCHAIYACMSMELQGITNEDEKLKAWKQAIGKFSSGIEPVHIDAPGNTVPPGITSLLNEVLRLLTHIDYSKRPINLGWVRARIGATIKILKHEKLYQKRLASSREMRLKRMEKQQRKINSLHKFVSYRNNYANE